MPETTPVAIFAATNYALKGLDPLLHALARVPAHIPLVVLVAGSPRTDRYRRLAHRFGVGSRVRFAGFCSDMRCTYFAADFLVHPTFYDPCSLVVLEALTCGLPVITSRFNGAQELLRGSEGFMIDDPHDHAALAECLVRLSEEKCRTACAVAAREAAARWTFEDHYRRLLAALAEAAERRAVRRRDA
jgi:UDP-glucose:(heptosyl)LPS alpha-1,3-glucosyltransferase